MTLHALWMILQFVLLIKNESVINALEVSSSLLFEWFNNNFIRANSDKSNEATSVTIDGLSIESSKKYVLGTTNDYESKFDEHVNSLCKKAGGTLNALTGIAPSVGVNKKRSIVKAFIESQFGYCPLLWMFHSRMCDVLKFETAYLGCSSSWRICILYCARQALHKRSKNVQPCLVTYVWCVFLLVQNGDWHA